MRLAGCNLQCDFCDTQYHKDGLYLDNEYVANDIRDSKLEDIVFTGGEPMLQIDDINDVMSFLPKHIFHLETNGTVYDEKVKDFNFIAVSPKKQVTGRDSYKKFNELPQTTFKFVYENKDDQWWKPFMKEVGINKNKI